MIFALLITALAGIGAQGAGLLVQRTRRTHELQTNLSSSDAVEAGLDALSHHLLAGMLTDANGTSDLAGHASLYAFDSLIVKWFELFHTQRMSRVQ